MTADGAGLIFDGDAEVTLDAQLFEPRSIDWKHVANVTRVGRDFASVHVLTRCSFQRVLQALLITATGPKREHAGAPARQESGCERGMCVERAREITDDL